MLHLSATKPAYSTTSAYSGATRQVSQTTQAKANYTGSYQTQAPQPVAATYSTTYSNTAQQQTATQTQTKPEKKPTKYIPASTASYQTQTATQVTPSSTSAYSTNYTTPQVQPQPAATPVQTTSTGKLINAEFIVFIYFLLYFILFNLPTKFWSSITKL